MPRSYSPRLSFTTKGNVMKHVLSYFAAILNVTIAVAIVAFGIFAVSETKAKSMSFPFLLRKRGVGDVN